MVARQIDLYAGGTGGAGEISPQNLTVKGSHEFDFGHENCGTGSAMAIKSKWT